jgi:hypothetical protein
VTYDHRTSRRHKELCGIVDGYEAHRCAGGISIFETDTQLRFIFDGSIYVPDEKIDPAANTNILLAAILMALNINNAQLSTITGEELAESDVEEAV